MKQHQHVVSQALRNDMQILSEISESEHSITKKHGAEQLRMSFLGRLETTCYIQSETSKSEHSATKTKRSETTGRNKSAYRFLSTQKRHANPIQNLRFGRFRNKKRNETTDETHPHVVSWALRNDMRIQSEISKTDHSVTKNKSVTKRRDETNPHVVSWMLTNDMQIQQEMSESEHPSRKIRNCKSETGKSETEQSKTKK